MENADLCTVYSLDPQDAHYVTRIISELLGLAGVLLILLLTIFNLSVADGVLNGFIFYANRLIRIYSFLVTEKCTV